jgi:hypothetical protein
MPDGTMIAANGGAEVPPETGPLTEMAVIVLP